MMSALGKPLVLEEFGIARDGADHAAGSSVRWRDRFFGELFTEAARLAEVHLLAGANIWAWGGEGRPRRPRTPDEATLLGEHCWRAGDALLGDPPHEAAGWYSVYDDDKSTHAVMASFSAALARLPDWF